MKGRQEDALFAASSSSGIVTGPAAVGALDPKTVHLEQWKQLLERKALVVLDTVAADSSEYW